MTTQAARRADVRFSDPETRLDGHLKVTGLARYLADRVSPDSLWLGFVRSPYPHARVVSVSTDAARSMPGVKGILSGRDVDGVRFGRRLLDWPILAWDRARFIGDRVAAVAAETPAQAAAAAAAIDVEYEELPAILSVEAAVVDGAPVLHPDAAGYTYLGPRRPPVGHPNIQGHALAIKGEADIEMALGRAHQVFEHRFTAARQHQGHIEPHGASAWIGEDGRIHVLTTNKSPFSLRNQLAAAFGIPADEIEVDSAVIGGDFGGKGLSLDDAVCIALARATGRPVSSVMSYADELQAANPRHGAAINMRSGVDRDGRILAHAAEFRLDGGAYAAGKPIPDLMPPGPLSTLSAYDIANVRVEATVYYTNTVPAGHMRNPGEVQTAFAAESHIDMIARALGADPVEFRLLNAARSGTTDVVGRVVRDPRATELLELLRADRAERAAAAERAGAAGPAAAASGSWRRGRGVALTARHMEGGRMTVRLRAHADGTIEIRTAIPDQGGGAHTMLTRVAASALGLPIARFLLTRETTAIGTPDLGVGASRVTYIGSRATAAAAEALRAELLRRLEGALGEPLAGLADDGVVRADGTVVATLEAAMAALGEPWIDAEGTFDSAEHDAEPQDFSLAAYSIEVDVDERTGAVRIVDAFLAADVGTVINPISHQGQVDGGFAFGIGAAWLEELGFDEGRVTTVHLGDYKLPTILDVPPLRTRYLHANGRGAFGAKMAGELSVSGVAPAIANAVADAAGARVTNLPLSPERVLMAIADGRNREASTSTE